MRSFAAAARRAEREAERRQRAAVREERRSAKEFERLGKQQAKDAELKNAQEEVAQYEERIHAILDVQQACGPERDWRAVLNAPPPEPPVARKDREASAVAALNAYKPTFFERLFGSDKKRTQTLCAAVVAATRADDREYEEAQAEFQKEQSRWSVHKELARGILEGDANSYGEAVRVLQPYEDALALARGIEFTPHDKDVVEVRLEFPGQEMIPHENKTLSGSGKLAVKRVPYGHLCEIYQTCVCGCALRVARETFALLPAEMAIVTVVTEVLDTQTGHRGTKPILSAAMPRQTISDLDFTSLDPVDAMANFVHRMEFTKSHGFNPVDSIQRGDLKEPGQETDMRG
ncbi:MAG: hypothetical protein ACYDH9_24205 [Limisphaerales bacterium]